MKEVKVEKVKTVKLVVVLVKKMKDKVGGMR